MLAIVFPAINPIAIHLGPLVIRWYALAYLVGFVGGWRYCMYLARRMGGRPTPQDFDDFLTWAVVGVILGGRTGYVLFYNLPLYLADPLEALRVWHGGMSFHGGFLGVMIAILLFARRRGFSPWAMGDLIACAAPIGLFFGRIANFVNGELYGRVTDVPWGIIYPNGGPLPRHPSEFYEAGMEGLILFTVLALLVHRSRLARHPGALVGVFITGYGIARIIGECFRQPDPQLGYLFDGITMGQVLSAPMVLAGIGVLVWALRRAPAKAPAAPGSVQGKRA